LKLRKKLKKMTLKEIKLTAQEFLDTIFADATAKEVVCVTKASIKDGKTLFWNLPDDDPVFSRWVPARQAQAWYFCVSTVGGARNDRGTALRRRRVDLVRYHCLVLDDIGTKASAPPVSPTWIIETSRGNYQYGYALYPGDDWPRYEATLEWCYGQGWGDAGAGGAMRVMRLPGSTNLKAGRGEFRSRVMWWEPNHVWILPKLSKALGANEEEIEALTLDQEKPQVQTSAGGAVAKPGIDPMLDWLASAGHIVTDDGRDFVQIICPWHERHTTGDNLAGYSPLGRGEGDWVQTRGFRCLHEHCRGASYRTFAEWAVQGGAPRLSGHDPLPWLQDKYTFIGEGRRVADLHQRPLGGKWLWELEDWAAMHKGRVLVGERTTPVEIKTAFLESKETRKVVGLHYKPVRAGADLPIVELKGQKLINNYIPPNWEETDVEPSIFLDHVDFLLTCDAERDLFLNWLAYKIQNPHRRSFAVVMVAEDTYGVGRSWLRSMLYAVLQGGVGTVTLPQLIGKGTSAERNFNDWAIGQFLVVEEAKDNMDRDDFYKGYETFKQNVDIRVTPVRVNEKYGRTRHDFMYFNALIFSNHSDALSIPENDRRICALTNPSAIETPAYYDRLEAALDNDEPRRVFWYLMRRDITDFDHVRPPMTPAKWAMIDQHRSPMDEIQGYILEHYAGDLFTKETLRAAIIGASLALDYTQFVTTPGSISRGLWGKMGSLREDRHGARYRIKEKQVEVRAIRAKNLWKQADDARLTKKFIKDVDKNQTPKNFNS